GALAALAEPPDRLLPNRFVVVAEQGRAEQRQGGGAGGVEDGEHLLEVAAVVGEGGDPDAVGRAQPLQQDDQQVHQVVAAGDERVQRLARAGQHAEPLAGLGQHGGAARHAPADQPAGRLLVGAGAAGKRGAGEVGEAAHEPYLLHLPLRPGLDARGFFGAALAPKLKDVASNLTFGRRFLAIFTPLCAGCPGTSFYGGRRLVRALPYSSTSSPTLISSSVASAGQSSPTWAPF